MEEKISYYLVLELRPKDFMPVDINLLLNNSKKYKTLRDIDAFTKNYTEEEIKEMIKISNSVPENYLNGNLQIINDCKYRYLVLTKDINFSIDTFFENYIDDKLVMNKFINIYNKYCSTTKDEMKKHLNEKNINNILQLLFSNSYEQVRNIYTYLYENIYNDKNHVS